MILKKLGRRFKKVFNKSISVDRYKHISEIPVHNYYECYNGNFECINKGVKYGGIGSDADFKAFNELTIQYENKYGASSIYQSRIRKIKSVIKFNQKFLETKDEFLLNTVNKLNKELEKELEVKGEGFDLEYSAAMLSKAYGQKIDIFTTTVTEFESIKKVVEKQNAQ